MSWSFPLTRGVFWEKLRIAGRPEFVLTPYRQQSQDGSENVISAKLGQPKWRADITTAGGGRHDDDMEIQALLKVLQNRDGTFLAYDTRRPYPLLDPGGALVSGFTPQIKSVGTDNRSVSIKGLPTGYHLSIGDKFAVTDGSGHRCLLEAMEAAATGGDDDTPEFEVQPFLPTWLAVDNTVDLVLPCGKFKIVAGSYKPQSGTGNQSDGISFSMIGVP